MRPVPVNLRKYLHRINPRVELAVEFLTVLAEDSVNVKSEWDVATQTPASTFQTFDDGTVTLLESDVLGIESIVSTAFITNLDADSPKNTCDDGGCAITTIIPAHFAAFELGDNWGRAARLRKFKAFISRQRVGGNPQFDGAFRLDLFTLAYYGPEDVIFSNFASRIKPQRDAGQLVPIGDPVYVNASDVISSAVDDRWPLWPLGATDEGLVTFDLTGQLLTVGELPIPELRGDATDLAGREYVRRIVLARISVVRGTTGANNVGWRLDPTVDVVVRAGGFGTLRHVQLLDVLRAQVGGIDIVKWLRQPPPFFIKVPGAEFDSQFRGVPRCEFTMSQYPTGTPDIEATVDLGSVPASAATVEFGTIFDKPDNTTLNPQVKDSIAAFQTFVDGQTAADLGLLAEQTYQMRFVMGANANRDTSPTGFELSVRDRTAIEVTDLVSLGAGNFSIDPRTMRAEIREIAADVVRDGVRDFRDRASRLAYEHHPDDIDIALYVRAAKTPLPPRNEWMLLDVFRVNDQESLWGAERFTAISLLEKLKRTIPRQKETAPSSGVFIRGPIVFAASTIANVWSTLFTEAQVPARYIGQPPVGNLEDPAPTGTDPVSFAPSLTKTISKVRECKREIDRLGLIFGGVTTTAHGRIVFRRLLGEKALKRFFRFDEITLGKTPRNLPQRMIEYVVPFGYLPDEDKFGSEVRSFDGDALTNLGVPTVGRRSTELDEEAAKYLPDAAHGRAIGAAVITAFGGGVLYPWEFASVIPHPELEVGDLIAFETDRLTVRDPISDREIKGRTFVKAVVAGANLLGTRFTVWVRSFSDIINVKGDVGDFGDVFNFAEMLSTSVVQGGVAASGTATVARSVVVDVETREVKVFRRRGTTAGDVDWPTQNGKQTGSLDIKYFKGIIGIADSFTFEDGGYTSGAPADIIRDIWVAVGFTGLDGEREEFTYTIVASPTPRFDTAVTGRETTATGTACTPSANRKKVTLSWTTIDTGAAQEIRVLRRVRKTTENPPYDLATTVDAVPATNTFVDEVPMFETAEPDALLLTDYKLQVNDDGGTPIHQELDLPEQEIVFGVKCRPT